MFYVLITFYVLICLVLSLVILLQQGRGGDIASAFGGNSSQAAFGARSGATVLTKATSVAGVLFMLIALVLSIIGQRGTGSVVSGTPAPKPIQAPQQNAPAPAAPAGTTTPAPALAPTATTAPATPPPAPAK
jgi:preprotein translocase subunit SecG